ncbi:MAG: plasmid pRiA4b ORF-3 family protein [Longimicrobiales bacterium]
MQFYVQLEDVHPAIWRRFQVPGQYTFWDLHVAVQDVMGWLDTHLHQFDVKSPETGETVSFSLPDDEGWSARPILVDWEHRIRDYFREPGDQARYSYDFGDDWEHLLKLEAILPVAKGVRYPTCLGGERACPPEDCGGVPGYEDLLAGDPDLVEWAGGDFKPEAFEPLSVRFSNPRQRWRWAFGQDG